MVKRLQTGIFALLIVAIFLAAPSCSNNPSVIPSDPFSTVWGPGGLQVVTFSGNSAGHESGSKSEFTLKLKNNASYSRWQGTWRLALVDTTGIVKVYETRTFSVPEGLETIETIQVTFDEGMTGPYGLAFEIQNRGQSIQTIWVGDKNTTAGPWPTVRLFPIELTEESSQKLAEDFVRMSPTYLFDGIEETLSLTETLYPDMENTWQFVYSFDSRHYGYGDRTGEVLLEVITPHECVITIQNGIVTAAMMDDQWNMLTQVFYEKEISKQQAMINAAEAFVRQSPTYQFDGIDETFHMVDVQFPAVEPDWVITIQFESSHAGFGDRTGDMLTQVITPHECIITVSEGIVTSAIMDGQWDMLNQEPLS